MDNWIDLIIRFIFVSSAFLLIMGGVSFLLVRVLKILGKARLWICSIMILVPLLYPLKSLLPDHIKVPVPLQVIPSFNIMPEEPKNYILSDSSMPVEGYGEISNVNYGIADTQIIATDPPLAGNGSPAYSHGYWFSSSLRYPPLKVVEAEIS